jgi:prevent-host-death family protein
MAQIVNMHEAKTQLSQLVARAEEGEEVILARNGKPVVRLVPVEGKPRIPPAGLFAGKIKMSQDFNEPLSDEYYGL